jgi:hypothetical protein
MVIEIVQYQAPHIPEVQAFNSRLRAAGVDVAFGISSLLHETNAVPARLPRSGLFEESFLAVEGEAVRGGYTLEHQDFLLNGKVASIGLFRHPLSEGTTDRHYSLVAPRLLRHALRRQPLLHGVGIGGYDGAAARLLKTVGFVIVTVPFYFRVEHAGRFLREVRILRSSPLRRLASDVGAATGVGSVGIGLVQRYRTGRSKPDRRVTARAFRSFDAWADAVWVASLSGIDFGAVRDHPVLAQLYDAPGNRFLKVVIEDAGEPCGWVVCLATQGHNHKFFGDLKLGSIVDCLVQPGYEGALIDAAVERLRQEDVDLIVTNQSLQAVGVALQGAGFLRGPSNFLLAASPMLAERFPTLESDLRRAHFNRGAGHTAANL